MILLHLPPVHFHLPPHTQTQRQREGYNNKANSPFTPYCSSSSFISHLRLSWCSSWIIVFQYRQQSCKTNIYKLSCMSIMECESVKQEAFGVAQASSPITVNMREQQPLQPLSQREWRLSDGVNSKYELKLHTNTETSISFLPVLSLQLSPYSTLTPTLNLKKHCTARS